MPIVNVLKEKPLKNAYIGPRIPSRVNDDLVAWYPLTEDFKDHKWEYLISGVMYDGTPYWNAIITEVSWVSQKCYSNQWQTSCTFTVPNTWDLQMLNKQTIMFWFNLASVSWWTWILWYSQGRGGYVYRLNYSSWNNPDNRELYYRISHQTWRHHMAWTYDGATAKMYFDGVLVWTYNYNYTLEQGNADISIWYYNAIQNYMSDIYFYKAPLDSETISNYYNSTKGVYGISYIICI